jgi:hypothetical protein
VEIKNEQTVVNSVVIDSDQNATLRNFENPGRKMGWCVGMF